MAPPPLTPDDGSPSMTLARLRTLLDAYGAVPDRWPANERAAALALLSASAEAQALQAAAAELDSALDLVATPPPSPELFARALANAPRNRPWPVRRWLLVAAVPLAAAAALALWLVPGREVKTVKPTQYAIEYQGAYNTPTDLLLVPPGFDLSNTAPTVGCTTGGLGCPELDVPTERQSRLERGPAARA